MARLIVMGGAFHGGNVTEHAEFNIWFDPPAAKRVFETQCPAVIVPYDLTRHIIVGAAAIARLAQATTPAALLSAKLLPLAGSENHPSSIHDAATIGWLLWPDLFDSAIGVVSVIADDGDESGRTLLQPDPDGRHRVLTEVDRDICIDRMFGVGLMTPEDAVSYGLTGPLLRATGVKRDLRKDDPYMLYDRFDFDISVGTKGDNFDRFSVRFEEIRQSMRIIEQALRTLPPGPVSIDDRAIVLPEKRDVYENIEGLMAQFKLVIEGIRVPAGEIYFAGEAANGELGFCRFSVGSGRVGLS